MVVDNTLGLLNKAQKASVGLAADTFSAVVNTTKTGLTHPDELVGQMAGFVSATGDMIGMAAQPLQTFIVRQQELAEAMETLAVLHAELAQVVATVASHHKGVVDALEALSSPILGFAVKTEEVPHPTPAAAKRKAPAKKAAPKKR